MTVHEIFIMSSSDLTNVNRLNRDDKTGNQTAGGISYSEHDNALDQKSCTKCSSLKNDNETDDSETNSTILSAGEENESEDEEDQPTGTLSPDAIKAKLEEESLEFAFLKPICAQVLQQPSAKNLKVFDAALDEIGKVPAHLSDFVVFPFAIHLKVIRTYKEGQRIRIYQSLAKLLEKAELYKSYDMFVNIFQKLHISLTVPPNVTTVNAQISDEELEAIVTCIKYVTLVSLSHHFDTLCNPDKVQIFGHSIFMLLQLIVPVVSKSTRLKTLQTLEHFVKLCEGSELRSKVLFKFLPGVISGLRKICLPSAGNSSKTIVIKSLALIGTTIRVSVEFENPESLGQADSMLSQIVELLSQEFVLNSDVDYRKIFFEFCCEVTIRRTQLPKCCKSISTILMRMKEDDERTISSGCVTALQNGGVLENLGFGDLTSFINSALISMNSGNQEACVLALREISSALSIIKLSFVEFQSFLPLLFQFVNEMVWKFRKVTVETKKCSDPIYVASCRACQNLVLAVDLDEVVFEFVSTLSEMQNNLKSVQNPTGVIVVFNFVLPVIFETNPSKISDFEAANIAEIYLTLLDRQSTEVAVQSIEADIPAVQSAADIRRCCILEGLGILGEIFRSTVVPIILYPLLEHAGTNFHNSEIGNEIAEAALKRLSRPHSIRTYLRENLRIILDEISVRMLNLLLYPNCPHALAFLAPYFDFSDESFASLIDQIFERCSDEFGGGSVQHIYVKVFYALLKSISHHFEKAQAVNKNIEEKSTLLQKMLAYQKAVGVIPPSVEEDNDRLGSHSGCKENEEVTTESEEACDNAADEVLTPVLQLVERICYRVLNFLPNNNRVVRLTAMDSLVLGVQLLESHENALLPLSHAIWQNLIPRIDERDYVVVRKSFELLQTLCLCSGTFLRKRTIEEAFPRLSILLLNLAKEGEQVKDKNRQYYTCTQAYKLQLSILQGIGTIVNCIDVQEIELDKIVSGCILYLKPNQHKNLREAAKKLLESISTGKHCRTVWMKLMASGFIVVPPNLPDPKFAPLPI